ncbi:MAG TPA: tetratricopeptide repeat protein [Terriglobales bacterium]|nr:tetratricopeptide repeat protein [Terriglobales bacterium]
MALGFGFNKTKVLAAAEKFVQQGKLPSAIAEYLKVIKEDPKDLTVMNTVGDLYLRGGQTAEAIQYFKQVGEAYASDGFTVKAIAIYKKLNKLNPSATDCVLKLAELYSQQGLYNDARAQYLSIAERCLRSGDNQQATRIFHKMLELDPENAAMQAKLADLYVKLGNKEEARNIFFTAAESLFRRGAMEAADEALERVLALDTGHTPSVMLRGQIAAETGNAEKAIQCLEKVPDLDSRPDALRALLRVHLQMGNISEALPIASKLLNVHNDLAGIIICGDHLMAAGQHEAGLRLYDQYADRLLADDRDTVLAKVASAPAHLNNNPAALELVLKLYRRAGDPTRLNEVMELLAHALVQAGELVRARDLYNQLAALEPENPLHAQNYRQVSARLGDDATTRPLTPDEGAQALMVDELEIHAPVVDQEYPLEVARAVRTALTDSELLDSYNLPSKAIAPLEAALPSAPRDVLLNQRLASLYVRAERYSDAARCCDILRSVYRKAGHDELAAQYAEMSAKYHERAGEPVPEQVELPEPVPAEVASGSSALSLPPLEVAEPAPPVMETATSAGGATRSVEVDASRQWEEMTAVEPPAPPASAHSIGRQAVGDVVGDLLEEIRFYVSQGMWEEAQAGIEKCAVLAPGIPELEELREQVEESRSTAAPAPEVEVVEEEPAPESSVSTLVFDAAALGIEEKPVSPPLPRVTPPFTEPAVQEDVAIAVPVPPPPPAVSEPVPVGEASRSAKSDDFLAEMVLNLEETLGEEFVVAPPAPSASAAPGASPPPSTPPIVSTPRPVVAPRALPPEPVAMPVIPAAAATIVAPQMSPAPPAQEPGSALSGIFEEFKEDMEADGAATEEQDPETHYNLGVAFKEMGLLDEAIGELQKVCHAIDRGHTFPHVLQVYTWLAECLMNKSAPQAAIKWYERALQLPAVDEETRMAVYYEMAAAYQAAGNRQAALDTFMEVYANNIDYRDVAERIKVLKA